MIVRTDPAYYLRYDTVAQAARKRLELSPYQGIRKLSCECNDEGVLFLRGHLPSFYHKQLAQHAVLHVAGVTQVVNEVIVSA